MAWSPHDVSANFNFPNEELKVLELWRSIDAFKRSIELNKDKPIYSFYDGPPFATGLPHYGHILAGTIKDTVTRYAHATGHSVERRFGWDTHGLPVEHEIDKTLGIRGREDVMRMGIERYNAECRAIVMRYSSEWRQTVERVGRWIDFDNDYKTLHVSYMESVWWVFKQLWEKNLVYCGLRVMPYSTACTTPLANFEASLNYKDVNDPAVTVAFQLNDDPETSLLIWTTTPWTLPSNLAICAHPDFDYVKIYDTDRKRNFILLEKCLSILYKNPAADAKKGKYQVVKKLKGTELKGMTYQPLFPYFAERFKGRAYLVVNDTYVTDSSGTGLVHQAPAFGDDDHRIAIANGIVREDEMPPCPIDDTGRYTSEVPDYQGQYVKDADDQIMKDLKSRGQLIVKATIFHPYPFCWRSDTPLIYRAIPVWFVRVKDHVRELVASNKTTHWTPSNIRDGRFGNWLEGARDWNISRNRYWGTPIPIWVSDDMQEMVAVGSLDELNELSNCGRLTDIHRENIDHITIPSRKGKGQLRRVEEVFDCWFESGSMPYAQQHYPFENEAKFKASFPADFVCEGLDQTRGWFYTLTVIGTLLFGRSPYQNLICTGIVLAEDGKKMSKRLKNYPDPNVIVELYGADAVRLFLLNSPVTRAENLRFRAEGVKEVVSRVLLPWLNSFRFWLGQVNLLHKDTGKTFTYDPRARKSENVMDRWILATCQSLIKTIQVEMKEYRLFTVIPRLLRLIEDLTNWYIRFNRKRLKGENGLEDTIAALNTLFEVLYTLSRTMAPFTPFLAENIYQSLRLSLPNTPDVVDDRSVHFISFPKPNEAYLDHVIERQVSRMQSVIELGRVVRERFNRSLKTPMKELVVLHSSQEYLDDIESLRPYVMEELNIRQLTLTDDEEKWNVRYKADADWAILGKRLRKDGQKVKAGLSKLTTSQIKDYQKSGKITIEGIPLSEGDLVITRYVEARDAHGTKEVDGVTRPEHHDNTDADVLVFLDITLYPELQDERLARELINVYQKLRKDAGLQTTDEAEVSYEFPAAKPSMTNGDTHGAEASSPEAPTNGTPSSLTPDGFVSLLQRQNEYILKTTKIPLQPVARRSKDQIVLREQTREIDGLAISLSVVKL